VGGPTAGAPGTAEAAGPGAPPEAPKSPTKEPPETDPPQRGAKESPKTTKRSKDGHTGRKGKGGFFLMNKQENKKILEAINLQTGEYSTSKKIELGIEKVDLNLLINRKDKFGEYAWSVISQIIKYSSSLVPGITYKFNDIDEAMRLGFNWSMGPL
jgi:hypothetical protein